MRPWGAGAFSNRGFVRLPNDAFRNDEASVSWELPMRLVRDLSTLLRLGVVPATGRRLHAIGLLMFPT